ncbi:hypothetical protein JL720_14368 [Aureococcus anophagefferens]|nr:hypothetical protein JL720_14368 [Aureococcus anophagefferens]
MSVAAHTVLGLTPNYGKHKQRLDLRDEGVCRNAALEPTWRAARDVRREKSVLVDAICLAKSLAQTLADAAPGLATKCEAHVRSVCGHLGADELFPGRPTRTKLRGWRVAKAEAPRRERRGGGGGADEPGVEREHAELLRPERGGRRRRPAAVRLLRASKAPPPAAPAADEYDEVHEVLEWAGAVLALAKTARSSADFGFLWYRELYLELSQQIQFPIELSLPWILAEHAARGGPGSDAVPADRLLAALPYALDVYDDAAATALRDLGKRHLYGEIEAEMNLAFDQLATLRYGAAALLAPAARDAVNDAWKLERAFLGRGHWARRGYCAPAAAGSSRLLVAYGAAAADGALDALLALLHDRGNDATRAAFQRCRELGNAVAFASDAEAAGLFGAARGGAVLPALLDAVAAAAEARPKPARAGGGAWPSANGEPRRRWRRRRSVRPRSPRSAPRARPARRPGTRTTRRSSTTPRSTATASSWPSRRSRRSASAVTAAAALPARDRSAPPADRDAAAGASRSSPRPSRGCPR